MNPTDTTERRTRVIAALGAEDSSVRLQAALAAGSHPDPAYAPALVERCGLEPDFYVRDMVTWALTRLPTETTLPLIRPELDSVHPQARGQALHTLSKIIDPSTWEWITADLLRDADDGVARTAWRTAVVLAPEDEKEGLAEELARQLGRGDRSVRLSLSRALIDLGGVVVPVLDRAARHSDERVAMHARATELLLRDPDAGFDAAVEEAKRVRSLGPDWVGDASGTGPGA